MNKKITQIKPSKMMTKRTPFMAVLFFMIVALSCDSLLEVENPGAIEEQELSNPNLETLIINGVIGEFQYTYSYSALYTGAFSDELQGRHTFVQNHPLFLRTIDQSNVYVNNVYSFWQRSRASADDAIDRLVELKGNEEAEASLNMVIARAYAGYSYIMLGETFCAAPVSVSRAYSSDELMEFAVERFTDAIAAAGRATAAGADAAEVERYRNLAQVGLARAHLNLGNMTEAATAASAVPADFTFMNRHSDNSARQYNPYFDATTGANNRYITPGVDFTNTGDVRIPHTEERVTSLVSGIMLYIPYQPSQFSGWTPADSVEFERNTSVVLASGLEARYIEAEANGAVASTLTFVNERRDVGGQLPGVFAGDALMEELRVQRSRDFFMSGRRLGDIRRYKALYGEDYFLTGTDPYYNEPYGTVECFPIPQSEINSNPNL
ncbi:MAG: RagB/SusD family nutrient uptake outer membrane protein [Balneolales bacterium]|nr:RagB/SusD family nutrient uptake outer membrane protein [Balneolales bacterium]